MGRYAKPRDKANKTEIEQRDQYFEDRRFIAKFLEKNLQGPQAAKVLHRFWWYRCEDNEIDVLMGRKNAYTPRAPRIRVEDEE